MVNYSENNIGAPKCKISFLLNFFQYCDRNIRVFTIDSCEVIALNILCFVLALDLCFFLDCSFFSYRLMQ